MNLKLTDVPLGIPPNTTDLYLGGNFISVVKNDSLLHLRNLKQLSFKGNVLVKLESGAFHNLANLTTLFLTGNKLTTLPSNIFDDLINLQWLYLTQNKLTTIPTIKGATKLLKLALDNNQINDATFSAGYKALTNLQGIALSNNKIPRLTTKSFKKLCKKAITKISLSRNSISNVEEDSFSEMPALKSLVMSYNNMTNSTTLHNVTSGLADSTQLTALNLDGVITNFQLTPDLFNSLKKVQLTNLYLSHSRNIDVIQAGTFSSLSYLELLDVSFSQVSLINDDAFTDALSLKTLLLHHNRLKLVPKLNLPKLQLLDLSFNSGYYELVAGSFDGLGSVIDLHLHHSAITTLNSDTFHGLSSLEKLDLSFNNIGSSSMSKDLFSNVPKLKTLNLRRNKLNTMVTNYRIFENILSLENLDMSENNCEQLAENIFTKLTALKTLDLHGNNLGRQLSGEKGENLFASLKKLISLNLNSNGIRWIPSNLFENLKSLQGLSLADNRISSWGSGMFVPLLNMNSLQMGNNRLSAINQTSLHGLNDSANANFSVNPFACYCDLVWFREWINTTNVTLVDIDNYICNSPDDMAHHSLLSFDTEKIHSECAPLPYLLILIAVVTGVVILIIVFLASMYRLRWKIRLRWYYIRHPRRQGKLDRLRRIRDPKDDQRLLVNEAEYDVCILHGEEDNDWVVDHLLPKIDNKESEVGGLYDVFYATRDAAAGKSEMGSLDDALSSCASILIVASTDYLNDVKGRDFEIPMALNRVEDLPYGLKSLILITMGDLAGICHSMHPVLKPVMENDGHIQWPNEEDVCKEDGQNLFWDELKEKVDESLQHNIAIP